jgi:hypothetical protein
MNETIVSRDRITLQALQAARLTHAGHPVPNTYPENTGAHALWQQVFDTRLAELESEVTV